MNGTGKILITGAPGWLGSRLLALIEPLAIPEIRCLVHPSVDIAVLKGDHPHFQFFYGDITDKASLGEFFENARGAVLLHLAGIVHAQRRVREFFKVNTQGAKNILEWAIAGKVKRMVAISSNAPAGTNARATGCFTEDSPYRPYRAYGQSKMEMEILLQNAHQKGDIETVVLRPCWFYGPGQPARQTLFFSLIKKGSVPVVGDGECKRSLSYVDDVCQALLLAAKCPEAAGKIYWIADERPYSMNEIIRTVEGLLEGEFGIEVKHSVLRLPNWTGALAGFVDDRLQKAGVYHQKIHVLSEMNQTIACSVAKARRELDFRPSVGLEEGMRRSIRWCLENGVQI